MRRGLPPHGNGTHIMRHSWKCTDCQGILLTRNTSAETRSARNSWLLPPIPISSRKYGFRYKMPTDCRGAQARKFSPEEKAVRRNDRSSVSTRSARRPYRSAFWNAALADVSDSGTVCLRLIKTNHSLTTRPHSVIRACGSTPFSLTVMWKTAATVRWKAEHLPIQRRTRTGCPGIHTD